MGKKHIILTRELISDLTITWSPRKTSLVTLKGFLPLNKDYQNERNLLPFVLTLPHSALAALMPATPGQDARHDVHRAWLDTGTPEFEAGIWALARRCALMLWYDTRRGAATRKQQVAINIRMTPRIRFRFARLHVLMVQQFFQTPVSAEAKHLDQIIRFDLVVDMLELEAQPGEAITQVFQLLPSETLWQNLADLSIRFLNFVLSPKWLTQVIYPARGRAARRPLAADQIAGLLFEILPLAREAIQSPTSYVAARVKATIAKAKEDPAVAAYLKRYGKEAPASRPSRQEERGAELLAVVITYHNFQKTSHPVADLLTASPVEVFRRYNNDGQFATWEKALAEEEKTSPGTAQARRRWLLRS